MAATMASQATGRSVAVVGAGPAGIIVAHELLRRGHRPTVFEQGPGYGGVWAAEPANPVIYDHLRTNLPKVVMQQPSLDFPAADPSYVTKRQLGRYIESLAGSYGLHDHTVFDATVNSVSPSSAGSVAGVGQGQHQHRWQVGWTHRADGGGAVAGGGSGSAANGEQEQVQVREFDAVVVATGHYHKPYTPSIPGQDRWLEADPQRRIMHSFEYKTKAPFKGKAVMVVGGRASGYDVSRDLRDVVGSLVCLDKSCTQPTISGNCTHVPLGSSLRPDGGLDGPDGKQIELANGAAIDTVILATGYTYDFPFLDEPALGMAFSGQRHVTPLYQHLLHASIPTLGFVGVPLSIPCPMPYFAAQARYIAACWTDDSAAAVLPGEQERLAWVAARQQLVGSRAQDMHTMAVGGGAWQYMAELDRLTAAGGGPGDPEAECRERERRFKIVEQIYADRKRRQPKVPWGDDGYRDCEYRVDWTTGEWTVDVA